MLNDKIPGLMLALLTTAGVVTSVSAAQGLPEDLSDYHGDKVKVIYKLKDNQTRATVAGSPLFPQANRRHRDPDFERVGLQHYFVVEVEKNLATVRATIHQLEELANVELAYLEPVPIPSGMSQSDGVNSRNTDFTQYQTYLNGENSDGTKGLNIRAIWELPGGKGQGVDIVTMECASYFFDHDDLPYPFMTMGDTGYSFTWGDHTTKSVGIMTSLDNGYGTTGIANQARQGWADCSAANIVSVADTVKAGSVLQIGMQHFAFGDKDSYCGTSCLVPVEWTPAWRDAISYATTKGINVVIPAGDGRMDLDNAFFNGVFDRSQNDTGAIYVAANDQRGGRNAFSNYGSRIDTSGWGENVTTTAGGPDNNLSTYTRNYAGTSAAGPMVAGAVAALQGVADANGISVTPQDIRDMLSSTGDPQEGGTGIGTQVNLGNAADMLLEDNQQVVLFHDINFGGEKLVITGDTPSLGGFNDVLSSLKVPEGLTAVLYEHNNYQGRSKEVTGDLSWVGSDFNDITSSVRLVSTVLRLYEHHGFAGQELIVEQDMPSLGNFDNQLTSLRIPEGATVILYDGENYQGESRVFTGNVETVGNFNDKASSLRIVTDPILLYQHGSFGGRVVPVVESMPSLGDFNDQLSSLKVPDGQTVVLFEHNNYQGASLAVQGDRSYVGNGFNDKASSLRIVTEPVKLFQNVNYGGTEIDVYADVPQLSNFNDELSSLQVPDGVTVILYEHYNYQGESVEVTSDTSWIGYPFNDKASSLRVIYSQ